MEVVDVTGRDGLGVCVPVDVSFRQSSSATPAAAAAERLDGCWLGSWGARPWGTTNEHQVVNAPKCISIYWIRLEYERLGTKLIRILSTWEIWVKLYSTSIYSYSAHEAHDGIGLPSSQ